MPIRRLPDSLINRIAAGEVIERPASAAKELIENAVDAGARRIDVAIRDGGQTLIAVVDDGCGIPADQLELAVERHATSKLPDEDLTRIRTLGFRGEALPSIAAVARVTITSRTVDADAAWSLTVAGGVRGRPQPAAHPAGTRIEVRDLFFATPARLKFLKAPATELSHILDVVNRLAMAHPEIGFSLTDSDRNLIRLSAAADGGENGRLARLGRIMGREFAENALRIEAERDAIRLVGYAGLPTLSRRNAASQFLFVNGRPLRDRMLHAAVRVAYQDVMAGDRHPMVVLFLDVPPDRLDVNVHPMKTEVRFRETPLVRGLIVSALRHALADAGHRVAGTAAAGLVRASGAAGGGRFTQMPAGRLFAQPPAGGFAPGLMEEAAHFQAPLPLAPGSPRAAGGEAENAAVEAETLARPLGAARAQVHGTFVIAETADGIVIVDQHAAHERILHERLQAALAMGGVPRQGLLIPEVVELGEAAAARLLRRADDLSRLGLVIESFGRGLVVVREVPAPLGAIDVRGLVQDLADDLSELDDALVLKDRLSAVCASLACHGSIRAGRRLAAAEMDALLREIEATPRSGQCSHGRPTHVELKLADIERMFGRR